MRKENTITYRVCNIKIYQTYLHPILSYIIIYYLCAMPNFKWCSLGIFKKTKCRNIATEVQLDLPGAWLSWPPKPSCGRKRRLCEDPSRTCQEHFPPRRIPGRQRVWGDTLDTLPTSDCNIAMTMSSKNINLCQIKVFLSNNSSYTQAFLNYLNQKKLIKDINPIKTPCFLAIIFPPHQSILKPSPPPKKKSSPSSPCNKYWSHSSVTFRRMRCRNSSNISQAAWGSSSLRRKTSKATATEVRGKRRRSSSTWKAGRWWA